MRLKKVVKDLNKQLRKEELKSLKRSLKFAKRRLNLDLSLRKKRLLLYYITKLNFQI